MRIKSRHWFAIITLGSLIGCTPETAPYRLAPATRSTTYKPCCTMETDPDTASRFPFPSVGQPVALPDCDQGPLNLADLIDIALVNSPSTQQTWAAARVAAAQYGESKSAYYPTVEGAGVALRTRQGFPFGSTGSPFGNNLNQTNTVSSLGIEEFAQYYPRLEMSWLLLDMGTRAARARVFREALNHANWSHNREIQTVICEIMVDYFNYQSSKELVLSSEADVADAEVNLDATLVKHRAGITDSSDVAMARTIVAQRTLKLLANLQQLEIAQGQLTVDLGIPSTEKLCVASLPSDISIESLCESVTQFVSRAYRIRPDLFAAWANLRSKKASVDQAIANLLPTLSFAGYLGTTTFVPGGNDCYDYLARLRINIPLFEGFLKRNKIKEARAELEAAKAQLRALEIAISQEVVVGYKSLKISGEKVLAGQDYISASQVAYQATLAQYKLGTVDFVTLAHAFSQLADARAALVLAKQDFFNSLAQLAYATGALNEPANCQNEKMRIWP